MTPTRRCPCGSGAAFDACCAPLHRGERRAATAEQVMRARYSAYAIGDHPYLLRSWAVGHRPDRIIPEPSLRWTGLTITDSTGGGMLDDEGAVTFEARYERDGRTGLVREASVFVRTDGDWVYVGPRPS